MYYGLLDVLEQMAADEIAGKGPQDVVLLAGQRTQLVIQNVERTLKGEA